MSHRNWPDFESYTLPDSMENLLLHAEFTFPGYVAQPGLIFLPLNALTHPTTNISPNVGRFCMGDGPKELTKNREEMGPSWHYDTKNVEYHCNSDGYRAPEWNQIDWPNSIVLLGCSMTYGVGVAEDETISHYLSEYTGRPVINLGYPSGSNELILNNLSAMFNKLPTPWAVAVNWTTLDRFTFYGTFFSTLGLWTNDKAELDGVNLGELYKFRNYSERNKTIENYYIAQCARAICRDRTRYCTISYFARTAHYMRVDRYVSIDNVDKYDRARDLIHPGPGHNRLAAQSIYEKLKDL